MQTYWEIRKQIVQFLNENKISAYDLAKVSKDLCSCGTCKYFIQHYSKDGKPIECGHCVKNHILKHKKPNTQSCGFWALGDEEYG